MNEAVEISVREVDSTDSVRETAVCEQGSRDCESGSM